MSTINFTVGRYSKKMVPTITKLGTVGDSAGNDLVFTFDEFVNGYGVLEIIKPTAVSTSPEQTFKYALTNTGSSYTITVDTGLLDTNCIVKLRMHIESNDIEVFKSTLCYMYIDGDVQSEIDSLEDDVSALGSTVSGLDTRTEAIEAQLSNNWEEWTPVLTWAIADPVTPTIVARYKLVGGVCTFTLNISSTDSNATTGLTVSLPEYRAENGIKDVFYSNIDDYQGFAYADDSEQTLRFGNFGTPVDGEPLTVYVNGTFEVGADLTEYNETLALVSEGDYTVESWTAYQIIVTANVVTTSNTQAEVDDAVNAIVAAQADLVLAGE